MPRKKKTNQEHLAAANAESINTPTTTKFITGYSSNGTPYRTVAPKTEHFNLAQSSIDGKSEDSVPRSESNSAADELEQRRKETERMMQGIQERMSEHSSQIQDIGTDPRNLITHAYLIAQGCFRKMGWK